MPYPSIISYYFFDVLSHWQMYNLIILIWSSSPRGKTTLNSTSSSMQPQISHRAEGHRHRGRKTKVRLAYQTQYQNQDATRYPPNPKRQQGGRQRQINSQPRTASPMQNMVIQEIESEL
jgi:hypothetical protein